MLFSTIIFCFLTLFSIASAAVIPIRRINTHLRSHNEIRRHARFVAERDTSTSSTQTLTATSSPSPSASSTSSTSEPSAQPSQPPVDADGSRKYVVAHHMVGNTFPFKLEDWVQDITLAHASGIDGFALNMGRDDWQPDRVNDAYEAAKQTGLDFKLFLSLDMASFPCGSPNDAQTLRTLVKSHADHPNQLQYASRAFVSTFAGENCNFGSATPQEGWRTQFSKNPELDGKIYFVPAFFIDPVKFKDFADVMDGDFNWNSGWPIQVTTPFAQDQVSNQEKKDSETSVANRVFGVITGAAGAVTDVEKKLEADMAKTLSKLQLALTQFIGSTDTDKEHRDGLAALQGSLQARDGEADKRAYMGAVSPWFFTHYGPDSFNKNFVFLSDQHLFNKRWESIIAQRDQFDIVQVLTWNDYGESHYMAPIHGAQPNSEAWTDGMDHSGWLELNQYYATAFKTGSFPAIETDKIIMWSRPHATKATSPDPIPQPTNFEIFEDAVWAVVMATEPSEVTLETSDSSKKTFNVPAGVTKLAIPITPGGTMKGTVVRNGQTVVELNPTEFTFEGSPKTYNYNAFVASASAAPPS